MVIGSSVSWRLTVVNEGKSFGDLKWSGETFKTNADAEGTCGCKMAVGLEL